MNTVQERSSPPIGTQDISDLLEAQPYRPFTVYFADGRRIAFPRRGLLASVPNGRTVTVFEPAAGLYVIESEMIARLETSSTSLGAKPGMPRAQSEAG